MKALHLLLFASLSILLFACQNSYNNKAEIASLSDTTSATGFTGGDIKLVKTAGIRFKVHDVEKSTRSVADLSHQLGGMVYNQTMDYTETARNELQVSHDSVLVVTAVMPQAQMTVRIPYNKLETFLYSVTAIGYFTSSSHLDIDDKSLLYLENILKQENRAEVLEKQLTTNKQTLKATSLINVKDALIDKEISNRAIDAAVNYSTVTLTLFQNTQVRKEFIANYAVNDYKLSFNRRICFAFSNGWQFFLLF